MAFSISSAIAHHARALHALELRCFDGDQLGLASFNRLLKSPSAEVLVITNDAEDIIGYALILTRKNSRWWRLYSVAIAPEYRGQGLSRKLMAEILTRASQAGAQGVRLEVKVNNHAAIELYRHYQFEVIDLLPAYYEDGSDGYRMQRSF